MLCFSGTISSGTCETFVTPAQARSLVKAPFSRFCSASDNPSDNQPQLWRRPNWSTASRAGFGITSLLLRISSMLAPPSTASSDGNSVPRATFVSVSSAMLKPGSLVVVSSLLAQPESNNPESAVNKTADLISIHLFSGAAQQKVQKRSGATSSG